jgi:hypothetical protein
VVLRRVEQTNHLSGSPMSACTAIAAFPIFATRSSAAVWFEQ